VDKLGDDVVPRAGPVFLRHRHGVADQFGGGGLTVAVVLRIVIADHLVRPGEDLAPVFLRYPQQFGDRLQWKLGGHVGDEVPGAVRHGHPDDPFRTRRQRLAQAADRPRRETPRDDPAQLGVLRWVDVEQDEPLHIKRLRGDGLRVADDRSLLLARVEVAGAGHLQHVRMPGDHPVPVVVEAGCAPGLRVPPDGRGAAQLGELIHGHPGQVGIGEVEPLGNARLGHRCLPL